MYNIVVNVSLTLNIIFLTLITLKFIHFKTNHFTTIYYFKDSLFNYINCYYPTKIIVIDENCHYFEGKHISGMNKYNKRHNCAPSIAVVIIIKY